MASQYITFIIIFTLGLSLVIITNNMFATLSDQFRENIAQVELESILEQLKMQIQQNLLIHPEIDQTISQQFELPTSLGRGFRYTIDISNSTDGKLTVLTGRTLNAEIIQQLTFSSGSVYIVSSSGEFTSINSFLNLYLQKNQNIVTILIS